MITFAFNWEGEMELRLIETYVVAALIAFIVVAGLVALKRRRDRRRRERGRWY